jgi:hypothetical protein
MKKSIFTILLIFAAFIMTSCTKYYLTKDMLTYEIEGQSASIQYYSNEKKATILSGFNYSTWRYNEPVGPGDSIGLFIIDRSMCRSTVTIKLGATTIYTGSTDNTGLLFINYKFHQSDFRLK